jgi:hypothetical protein
MGNLKLTCFIGWKLELICGSSGKLVSTADNLNPLATVVRLISSFIAFFHFGSCLAHLQSFGIDTIYNDAINVLYVGETREYAIKLAISFSKPRREGGFLALTLGALCCARDNST